MSQISFRKTVPEDLAKIIDLVNTHDEDDAEAVADSLQAIDFANHFCMLLDNTVIGITGYAEQSGCDHTFYLSWTYLHVDQCGKGYGRQMMQFIVDELKSLNARKVFVKISDYVDPEDGPVYATALQLYQKFGFEEEVKLANYYDLDESMIILGLRLIPSDATPQHAEEKPALKFVGMFCVSETEATYSFEWEPAKWWKGSFGVSDIYTGLDAAYAEGAQQVVLSFPSTYHKIQKILLNAGFDVVGCLKDYYEDGVDEVHYQIQIKQTEKS